MPDPSPEPNVPTDPARRAGRPAPPRASGFGPTGFGAPPAPADRTEPPGSAFDVCHVGVVLRALVGVHAVVGIGVAFGAAGPAGWLRDAAGGSAIALPAVLLWLLVACAARRPLGRLPLAGQWVAALALGAACGGCGAVLAGWSSADAFDAGPPAWRAAAAAGAALAAVLFQWLQLRARAAWPADTAARLAELQARIRPHFLFNTLNTALALVRLDPARAEGVLEDLAELFRVAMSDSAAAASLDSEVELAQRYLAIEQIRFGPRLSVTWELDPAAGRARLPPLLLQPLVENAVLHGIEPAAGGGVIRIRTEVRLGRAVVSISNSVPDGPARPGHGIALDNVRERLRLLHDVAGVFETKEEGGVYRVRVAVPL